MFIEGRISLENPQYDTALKMVGAGNSIAADGQSALVVQQTSDRTYRVYMGVQVPESFTRPGGDADLTETEKARAVVLEKFFEDWDSTLRAFVEECEGPWRAWPWYHLDPEVLCSRLTGNDNQTDSAWGRSMGVTLLGDAAHLATPNGEGVNMALQDALVLFECILTELGENAHQAGGYDIKADAAALERACVAYETDMRPRGRETIENGKMMEEMIFAKEGMERMLAEKGALDDN